MLQPRHILDVKKEQIEKGLMELFTQVRESIDNTIGCLGAEDKSVCKAIVDNDREINEARRLLEQDCLVAIASQQPMGHDLREIVAGMRVAAELERIGDYASDIAASVMQMDSDDLSTVGAESIIAMSRDCVEMLDQVASAFQAKDAIAARRASGLDDRIDQAQTALIKELFENMQNHAERVPDASRMLWISHNLERCGDRATNIAEQIVFMTEGEVVELD